ncbi:hypothetical protein HRR83_008687 [Exophiala dermatitidis]|uniref:Uncharacterized protein n=1 Tax=Exophiala dermatitidis TaxID=5970 RepID=A0AAN6ITN5_EXODE|nr:hypothetical protein HRR75_007902 [Exophiala dermatitidis]KAJ4505229.1 hypothetical protein HRR73_008502 [Exophiala dermatitidis]KAJ4505688.1 hypothetical protein HRR74_008599 [Exophiala dermatitidis]KAJ4536385.1 hypothetical protein HRR77_007305 [Exophiala dermatitidis]KAJ4538686.1 hypothetical protein HRR78_008023 [Exophiala dermatitidis]
MFLRLKDPQSAGSSKSADAIGVIASTLILLWIPMRPCAMILLMLAIVTEVPNAATVISGNAPNSRARVVATTPDAVFPMLSGPARECAGGSMDLRCQVDR